MDTVYSHKSNQMTASRRRRWLRNACICNDFILKIRRTEVLIAGYRLWHYKYVYLFTSNKYNW